MRFLFTDSGNISLQGHDKRLFFKYEGVKIIYKVIRALNSGDHGGVVVSLYGIGMRNEF